MVDIIVIGLFIGFLTSAPMGPVGVLCVQRTLNEGRRHGLFTGLGASLSDVIYAIIAGLGMGFVIEFVETNQRPLLILGSFVLVIFGSIIYLSNPAKKLQKQEHKSSSLWKACVSSFFLNLSNIGILFLYIALFARFKFIAPGQPFSFEIAGILSIGIGAILWWFLVTYLINKLRDKVNLRGLAFFNKILGIILILIGIAGLVRGIYQLFVI